MNNPEAVSMLVPPPRKPAASAPTNHEIAGYMPGRGEFEYEVENDAETHVKEMIFDGTETNEEKELKVATLSIYNARLQRRLQKKQFLFERGLTEMKKWSTHEKKISKEKEENDMYKSSRAFARLVPKEEYDDFMSSLNGILSPKFFGL